MQPALSRSLRWQAPLLRPRYLEARDHGWLEVLLAEHAAFVGRRRREWNERLKFPLGVAAPPIKLEWACAVLEQLGDSVEVAEPSPERTRQVLFRSAAVHVDCASAIAAAAQELALDRELVLERLLSDLPLERRLRALPQNLSPAELSLRTNSEMAGAFLKRSRRINVTVRGSPRYVLRHARRLGLICVVRRTRRADTLELDISGPLSLFRHTRVYGRALASLLPRLANAAHYELRVEALVDRDRAELVTIAAGDPIAPSVEVWSDEAADARFVERFRRATRRWTISTEPGLLVAGEHWLLPDFELVSTEDPRVRWYVERAGFWTPATVEQRLAALRAAGFENVIVCVDPRKNCGGEGAAGAEVVPQGAGDVARILERIQASHSTMP